MPVGVAALVLEAVTVGRSLEPGSGALRGHQP